MPVCRIARMVRIIARPARNAGRGLRVRTMHTARFALQVVMDCIEGIAWWRCR